MVGIQTLCREAMTSLAGNGHPFTESDVVIAASQRSADTWTEQTFREAAERAYAVLQAAYKQGKLVRFGPVSYSGTHDYARRDTKIVYASLEGPTEWRTPNGVFPRIYATHDPLLAPGRRSKEIVNRDDSKLWSTQRCQSDLVSAKRQIRTLQDELNRLRGRTRQVA